MSYVGKEPERQPLPESVGTQELAADAVTQEKVDTSVLNPIVQIVYHKRTDWATFTAPVIAFDDTIPQITEGAELFTKAITPKVIGNILVIDYAASLECTAAGQNICVALFDGNTNAIDAQFYTTENNSSWRDLTSGRFIVDVTALTTKTYSIRVGTGVSGNLHLNGISSARRFGGVSSAIMTITEIAQ